MKNLSRHATRTIVAFIALLFLATALLPVYQVWQDHQDKKIAKQQENKLNSTPKLTGTKLSNFTPVTQPQAGLQVIDTKVGDGTTIKAGDTITADYVGALMSTGVIFDAAADHGGPVSFPLSGVIAGWSKGIPGMKVGGSRRLLIPAALAYGPQAQQAIPANSDLVFDVTVVKIGK